MGFIRVEAGVAIIWLLEILWGSAVSSGRGWGILDGSVVYLAAFASGFLFGVSDVFVRIAMEEYRAGHMLLVSLAVGSPLLWLAAYAAGDGIPEPWPLSLYAIAGILNFVVGRLLFYLAVASVGVSSASVLTSPSVVLSGILAWALLGETLRLQDILGLSLVAASIIMTSRKPSGTPLHGSNRLLGVAAGLASSLTFAASAVAVRVAGLGSGSPLAGAAVSYTAALPLAVLVAVKSPEGLGGVLKASRKSKVAATVAAAVVAVSQLLRYTALSMAPIAKAVVLISLYPLHATALAHLALQNHGERVRPVHMASALVASAGTAMVVAA